MQPTMLIFDDDQDILDLFARICQKIAIVRTSTDPWLFLDENTLQGVALIIMDERFGSKSGLNLVRQIKAQAAPASLPVILQSGHDLIELMAAQAGADGFLKKPASIAAIRSCVQHHINAREISASER